MLTWTLAAASSLVPHFPPCPTVCSQRALLKPSDHTPSPLSPLCPGDKGRSLDTMIETPHGLATASPSNLSLHLS